MKLTLDLPTDLAVALSALVESHGLSEKAIAALPREIDRLRRPRGDLAPAQIAEYNSIFATRGPEAALTRRLEMLRERRSMDAEEADRLENLYALGTLANVLIAAARAGLPILNQRREHEPAEG